MVKDKKLVAYVGPFSFPEGGAAARRIYGNCVSLQCAGYDVIVASGQVSDSRERNYNGISVVSLSERRYEKLPKIAKHLMYLSAGRSAIRWLNSMSRKPDVIIVYSGYSPYLIRLIPWARKNNVKIIFDVVEWYDPPNCFSSFVSPYYLNIEFAMRFLIKRCDGLIVISEYLRKYYSPFVKNIIKVPPTATFNERNGRVATLSCPVRFVYAGRPGKKEDLTSVILAVMRNSEYGENVELNVAGLSEEELEKYLPIDYFTKDRIYKVVKCHGVLNHDKAKDLVMEADYSIIIRPKRRNVQAGFPTKFVESMSLGTPVIANLTSDIADYLEDGVNGLICPNCEIESIVKVVGRAIAAHGKIKMGAEAKRTAKAHFSPEVYAKDFKDLIG